MKKYKIVLLLSSLVVCIILFETVFLILFYHSALGKMVVSYYTKPHYDSKYESVWKSDDGALTIICNCSKGLAAPGRYKGVYETNHRQYEIEFVIDEISYADFGDLDFIFFGSSRYDFFNDTFSVNIEAVYNKISQYHRGETIIFHQVDTQT